MKLKLGIAFLSFAVFLFGMWCLCAAIAPLSNWERIDDEMVKFAFYSYATLFVWPVVVFAILGTTLIMLSLPGGYGKEH